MVSGTHIAKKLAYRLASQVNASTRGRIPSGCWIPTLNAGPATRYRTARPKPTAPLTAPPTARGRTDSSGSGQTRSNATRPPTIEIASQTTMRMLPTGSGATNADDIPRTTKYAVNANATTSAARFTRSRRCHRPVATNTNATAAIAGCSSRIVPIGVSSVTPETEARRNRMPRHRYGRRVALAAAAIAAVAERIATRMDPSDTGSAHDQIGPQTFLSIHRQDPRSRSAQS